MFNEKIVVSGMGMVGPLGSDINLAIGRLASGESGIKVNDDNEYCHYLAPVQDYDATRYVAAAKLRRMEALNHYAINAVGDALLMAGITPEQTAQRNDTGVLVGTGYAGIESVIKHQKCLFDDGIKMLRPVHFPTTVYNATAGMIAIEHQLKGINSTVTGLDMPGEYALLYAAVLLQKQPHSKVVVLGADSYNDRLQQGLHSLGFLAKSQNESPSRAFEPSCDGIIMGEGAAALVLETEASARQRGATIYAEINGIYQHSSADDPYSYARQPSAMKQIIQDLEQTNGQTLRDFNLLSLSANGVPPLDQLERRFIEEVGVVDIPCRTLCDYIGAFPGAGMLRLLLSIASFRRGSHIHSLQGDQTAPSVNKLLHRPIREFNNLIHFANGLGGNAMAIDVRVPQS